MKHFYEIPVKIRRGTNQSMPSNLLGAHVNCYILTDSDHLEAVRTVVNKLTSEGYIFEDLIKNKAYELDPYKWDEYINSSWSEYKEHFLTQEELLRLNVDNQIFYGPFIGWDSE